MSELEMYVLKFNLSRSIAFFGIGTDMFDKGSELDIKVSLTPIENFARLTSPSWRKEWPTTYWNGLGVVLHYVCRYIKIDHMVKKAYFDSSRATPLPKSAHFDVSACIAILWTNTQTS